MDKIVILNKIKELYEEDDINIIKWLKEHSGEDTNDMADILISYDFQAGTYIDNYLANKDFQDDYLKRLASIIDELVPDNNSILECGCGEGTVIVPLLNLLKRSFRKACGIDISWSRVRYGMEFASKHLVAHGGVISS